LGGAEMIGGKLSGIWQTSSELKIHEQSGIDETPPVIPKNRLRKASSLTFFGAGVNPYHSDAGCGPLEADRAVLPVAKNTWCAVSMESGINKESALHLVCPGA
jgi:hypothetical protein